jgi:hypothetical protein
MTFNYEVPGKVKINIDGFIKDLLDTFQDIVGGPLYSGQSPSGILDEKKERKEEVGRLKMVCLVS